MNQCIRVHGVFYGGDALKVGLVPRPREGALQENWPRIGPDNDKPVLTEVSQADPVIAGWGDYSRFSRATDKYQIYSPFLLIVCSKTAREHSVIPCI